MQYWKQDKQRATLSIWKYEVYGVGEKTCQSPGERNSPHAIKPPKTVLTKSWADGDKEHNQPYLYNFLENQIVSQLIGTNVPLPAVAAGDTLEHFYGCLGN